jgi:hypothetical protein
MRDFGTTGMKKAKSVGERTARGEQQKNGGEKSPPFHCLI